MPSNESRVRLCSNHRRRWDCPYFPGGFMQSSKPWVCNKLGDGLGAEIVGLDLSQEISDEALARLLDCFHENAVLVIRDQELTPEQHIAFSKRIGPLQIHVQN